MQGHDPRPTLRSDRWQGAAERLLAEFDAASWQSRGADTSAPTEKGAGDVDSGKRLFAATGCIACHTAPGVPGATGTIGPNLTEIANRSRRPQLAGAIPNTPENLKRWVQDAQAIKPGTMMPNLNLGDQEADDLVAFLETLR